ncbi:entericidin A/B family lipoprotein [Vreelandella sp. EE22]
MTRTLALGLLLLATLFVASGCNTIHGAGEDIERGGSALQQAAE